MDDKLVMQRALTSEREEEVFSAIDQVAMNETPSAVPLLFQTLSHPSTAVRRKAINTLAKFQGQGWDSTIVTGLLEVLQKDPDERIRRWASDALSHFGQTGLTALLEGLNHGDPSSKQCAASSFQFLGASAKIAIPDLVRALGDRDDGVASSASISLECIGTDAMPLLVLVEGTQTSDDRARYYAAATLYRLDPENQKAIQLLTSFLRNPDARLRERAASVLYVDIDAGKINVLGLPDYLHLLEDSVAYVRGLAATGIKATVAVTRAHNLEPVLVDRLVRALCAALEDDAWEVRDAAMGALGVLGPRAVAAVPKLTSLLASEHGDDMLSSTRALAKIGSGAGSAIPALRQLDMTLSKLPEHSEVDELRQAVNEAVAAIQSHV